MNRSIRTFLACSLAAFGLTRAASADIIPSPSNDILLQSNGGVAYSSLGTGSWDGLHGPDKLNDGNRDGNFGDTPIGLYHSAMGANQGGYFGVTTSNMYDVTSINVFDRTDCCTGRLDGGGAVPFTAEVLLNGVVQWSTSATETYNINIAGAGSDSATGSTITVPGVVGNEVRIIQNNADYINIAELEAYGRYVPEPSSMVLCGLGAVGLLVAARRRRQA